MRVFGSSSLCARVEAANAGGPVGRGARGAHRGLAAEHAKMPSAARERREAYQYMSAETRPFAANHLGKVPEMMTPERRAIEKSRDLLASSNLSIID